MNNQVETTETDDLMNAIREAFDVGQDNESDEDTIKIEMISAGATFKNVTRLYNEFMIDAGLLASKEDKEKSVASAVSENNVSTEDGFNKAVESITADLESVNERGAAAMIRAYCKKNSTECFKKPKSEATRNTKDGVNQKLIDMMVDNPNITEKEISDFIDTYGTNGTKNFKGYWQRIRSGFNEVAKKNNL